MEILIISRPRTLRQHCPCLKSAQCPKEAQRKRTALSTEAAARKEIQAQYHTLIPIHSRIIPALNRSLPNRPLPRSKRQTTAQESLRSHQTPMIILKGQLPANSRASGLDSALSQNAADVRGKRSHDISLLHCSIVIVSCLQRSTPFLLVCTTCELRFSVRALLY